MVRMGGPVGDRRAEDVLHLERAGGEALDRGKSKWGEGGGRR